MRAPPLPTLRRANGPSVPSSALGGAAVSAVRNYSRIAFHLRKRKSKRQLPTGACRCVGARSVSNASPKRSSLPEVREFCRPAAQLSPTCSSVRLPAPGQAQLPRRRMLLADAHDGESVGTRHRRSLDDKSRRDHFLCSALPLLVRRRACASAIRPAWVVRELIRAALGRLRQRLDFAVQLASRVGGHGASSVPDGLIEGPACTVQTVSGPP